MPRRYRYPDLSHREFIECLAPLPIGSLPEDAKCPICYQNFHDLLPAEAELTDALTHSFFAHLPFALPFGLPNTSELDLPVRLPCAHAQREAAAQSHWRRRNRVTNQEQAHAEENEHTPGQESPPAQANEESAVIAPVEPAKPNHILGLACLRSWINTLQENNAQEGTCPICRAALFECGKFSTRYDYYSQLDAVVYVPYRTHIVAHRYVPNWHTEPKIVPQYLLKEKKLIDILGMLMAEFAEKMGRGDRMQARDDWLDSVLLRRDDDEREDREEQSDRDGFRAFRLDLRRILRATALDEHGHYPAWLRVLLDADTECVISALLKALSQIEDMDEEPARVTPGDLVPLLMSIIEPTLSPKSSSTHANPEAQHFARMKRTIYTHSTYGFINILRELTLIREKAFGDRDPNVSGPSFSDTDYDPTDDEDENIMDMDEAIFDDMSDEMESEYLDDGDDVDDVSDVFGDHGTIPDDDRAFRHAANVDANRAVSVMNLSIGGGLGGRMTVSLSVNWMAANRVDADGDSQMIEVEDQGGDADADDEGEGSDGEEEGSQDRDGEGGGLE